MNYHDVKAKIGGKYCVTRDVLVAVRVLAGKYDWCSTAEYCLKDLGLLQPIGTKACECCVTFPGYDDAGYLDESQERFPFQAGTPETIEASKLLDSAYDDTGYGARQEIYAWLLKNSFTERGAKRIASRRVKEDAAA